MQFIDNIESVLGYLVNNHCVAKCSSDYHGLTAEYRIAGKLMGLTEYNWWYVIIENGQTEPIGLIYKNLFDELYRNYYIYPARESTEDNLKCYVLNTVCEIQEMPRYQHQIDSWQEMISEPGQAMGFNQ